MFLFTLFNINVCDLFHMILKEKKTHLQTSYKNATSLLGHTSLGPLGKLLLTINGQKIKEL